MKKHYARVYRGEIIDIFTKKELKESIEDGYIEHGDVLFEISYGKKFIIKDKPTMKVLEK